MITATDILQIIGVVVATVAMIFVLRWRRRGHREFLETYAEEEVCEHLRPALMLLKQRGHQVRRAGQVQPDFPLEIHVAPPFDPKALAEELKLEPPVFVSERNVLFCREDACEIHPVR